MAGKASKQDMRSQIIRRRDGMDQAARNGKSARIASLLLRDLDAGGFGSHSLISVYASMGSEVSLDGFIEGALGRGCALAFPCMMRMAPGSREGRSAMVMRRVSAAAYEARCTPFVTKPLRLFDEQDAELADFPLVQPEDIDLIVVPLVAFDASGMRLGYGGGNYDRYLPRLKAGCRVVGAGFEEQRVIAVPCDELDIAMQVVSA